MEISHTDSPKTYEIACFYVEAEPNILGPVSWNDVMDFYVNSNIDEETNLWAAHMPGWTPLKIAFDYLGRIPLSKPNPPSKLPRSPKFRIIHRNYAITDEDRKWVDKWAFRIKIGIGVLIVGIIVFLIVI